MSKIHLFFTIMTSNSSLIRLNNKCWTIPYKFYYINNYYSNSGMNQFKTELFKNGLIAYVHEVIDGFLFYIGGICSQNNLYSLIMDDYLSLDEEKILLIVKNTR